ncbi:DUF1592 domain-containing protein [Phenylobacterium sp. LjRoot225]|uniref:DUF1592 domain-containing protein n=1 Tax=Phenylobacterium sp. LjRoot225 TaxID=3342285 RepID=UPI003ECDE295
MFSGRRFRIASARPFRSSWVFGLAATVVAGVALTPAANQLARAAGGEPATVGGSPGFRRLNDGQYARTIAQIFGPGIKTPGRFDPPLRDQGLMAIGDGKVVVSASGIEQYELRAREISAQVLSDARRDKVLTCAPKSTEAFDVQCASEFFETYGRLLYRRPLSPRELNSVLAVASAGAGQSHSFHKGLEAGLSRLLASPKFIFRVERGEPDPQNSGQERLDAYSLATRVSFLLWDAPPDAELLDAAARGDLYDRTKLEAQVDRLMASPRFEQGVRSFFSDMFGYEQFAGLTKDQSIYPKFSSALAKDAQEQALRTIVDLLVTQKGDYRDLFTTKKTFINRNLGALYKVAVDETATGGGWAPYTFAASDPRAGILTLPGFLMLDPTHEGRSSPTIRGKTVRELFLCQQVPQPPANVDFSAVQNTADLMHKTARERLAIHVEDASCAGCHKLTDPIGLSMENYDAIGAFRARENGAPIDASGAFDGKPYLDVIGLQTVLRDSPAVPACLVQRTFEYGVGRPATPSEQAWLEYATERFAGDKHQVPALMRRIATGPAFRSVASEPAPANVRVAAAN